MAKMKHLTTGVLAIALGGSLVSCSDDSLYQGTIAAKQEAYEQAFVETYGQVAANKDWGFGSQAAEARMLTRTHDKNSNMWADEGYVIPDPLTEAQKDKVRRYFQQNREPHGVAVEYTDFFVQQVYKGGSNLEGSLTEEKYLYGNGDIVTGSSNMDKLTAGSIEDHINDFNYGDRGEINVQNNSKVGEHMDAITLMIDSSTDCFGFHNSRDSHQYNDQYVIVSGDDIDAWDPTGESVAGMFFVGFDFEADQNYEEQPVNTNEYLVTEVAEGTPGAIQVPNRNDGKWYTVGGADGYYSDWIVRITEGVKRPDEGTEPETPAVPTVTIVQTANGQVLTQTRVEVTDVEECMEQGRVFCEDLGQVSTNDIDFNDVVFDAQIIKSYQIVKTTTTTTVYDSDKTTVQGEPAVSTDVVETAPSYKAKMKLVAAGGTLQLTVAGQEVHGLFGDGISTSTMVNTVTNDMMNITADYTKAAPVDFEVEGYTAIADIPIVVLQSNATVELRADIGKAPQKILAPIGTRWARERIKFGTEEGAYGDFEDYVTRDDVTSFWDGNIVEERLYDDDYAEAAMEKYPTTPYVIKRAYNQYESSYSEEWTESEDGEATAQAIVNATIYKDPMATPAAGEVVLSGQEHRFIGWDGSTNKQYLKAELTGLGTGSKLRIYGAGTNDMAVKLYCVGAEWGWTELASFDAGNATSLTTNGYFEYTITADDYAAITAGQGIALNGTAFTCTYITLDNSGVQAGGGDNGDDNSGDVTGGDDNSGDDNSGDVTGGDDTGGTTSGTQLWPESGTGSETASVVLPASKFANVTAGQVLRIYCTFGDSWWSCTLNFADWRVPAGDVENWTVDGSALKATEGARNTTAGHIDLPISSNLLSQLQASDVTIWFGNITVSKITIE